MNVQAQIDQYIADQAPPKRAELQELHRRIVGMAPDCKLWFLDGKDDAGKVVSNPNVGYGSTLVTYANGRQKEFYRVGLSANTAGLSVYIMGLNDRLFLSRTYGDRLGRAKVTGYCIRFRSLRDVDIDTLQAVIADAMRPQPERGS